MAVSESAQLGHVIRELVAIKRELEGRLSSGMQQDMVADVAHAISMLSKLKRQASASIHRNPARRHTRNPQLVVYNPPDMRVRRVAPGRVVGQIASNVHEVRYQHAEDGELYKHPFNPGVKMFALDSGEILLTSEKPLWEDF